MKNTFFKLLLLAFLILTPFYVQETFACECSGLSTPYKAYQDSTTVFVGKVLSVQDTEGKDISDETSSDSLDSWRSQQGRRSYRFEIQELLKGTRTLEVNVSIEINMCQFGLDKGGSYLVYAYERAGSETGLAAYLFCSRTGSLETTQDDVHFLRALLKNKSEPRIYGSVLRFDKTPAKGSSQYTYLEGIKIIAQRGKRRFETTTDQNGLYRFNKLPDGKYRVYPELPGNYQLNWWYHTVEINLSPTDDPLSPNFLAIKGPNAYTEFQVIFKN